MPEAKPHILLDRLFATGIVILALLTGALFYLYLVVPEIFHATGTTFALILALLGAVYTLRSMSDDRVENAVRLAATYMLLTAYIVRFLALTVWPYDFGRPDGEGLALRTPTVFELNRSIGLAIAYVGAFIAGLFLQRLLPAAGVIYASQRPANAQYIRDRHEKVFRMVFSWRRLIVLVLVIAFVLQAALGFLLGWQMGAEWESGWLTHLVPVAFLTQLVTILLLVFYKRLSPTLLVTIGLFFIASILAGIQQGSRSGLYAVLNSLLFAGLFLFGNFRVPRRALMWILVVGVVLGPLLWLSASAVRYGTVVEAGLLQVGASIARRLGAPADSYIAITNDWGDRHLLAKVTDTGDGMKRTINSLVPGDVFEVEMLPPGAMYKFIYWGVDAAVMHGDVWSGFGWYYASFGLPGSLFFVLLTSAFFTYSLRVLFVSRSMIVQLAGFFLLLWIGFDFFNVGVSENFWGAYIMSVVRAGGVLLALSFVAFACSRAADP